MGSYLIIRPRSETSEEHANDELIASDTGRGSGTSLTVVSSPGVKSVPGMDTDEPVAKMVTENVKKNGPESFAPIVEKGDSLERVSGIHKTTTVNTAVDAATKSNKDVGKPSDKYGAHTIGGTTDSCKVEAEYLSEENGPDTTEICLEKGRNAPARKKSRPVKPRRAVKE